VTRALHSSAVMRRPIIKAAVSRRSHPPPQKRGHRYRWSARSVGQDRLPLAPKSRNRPTLASAPTFSRRLASVCPVHRRCCSVAIRTLYESQEFNFVGPVGDNGLLEDYTAQVRGEPVSCVVLVTRDAAGQAQHIVANYRPRSSLLLLSRLVGEKLAGTPYAGHFAASQS
jgi:hypothetical protein